MSKASTNGFYQNPHTAFKGQSMYVGRDILLRVSLSVL